MKEAVENYASYLDDPNSFMLARFVVPASRLDSFVNEASSYLNGANVENAHHDRVWQISALVGPDLDADLKSISQFNSQFSPHSATIDVVELKASSVEDIRNLLATVPASLERFVEVPVSAGDLPALVKEIADGKGYGKIRTGGITSEAFPTAQQVARFILACKEQNLPFKATAGLHHPIRAEYRLTYDPNPPTGVMYGYLNIFIAALLAWKNASEEEILQVLTDTDILNFTFDSNGLTYRGQKIPVSEIAKVRKDFAISFGSCSFREPVDDLIPLGLQA